MDTKNKILTWVLWLAIAANIVLTILARTQDRPIPAWFANTAIEVCQQHEGLKEFSYSDRKFGPVVCKNGIQIVVPQSFQKPEVVDFDGAVLYDNKVSAENKGE